MSTTLTTPDIVTPDELLLLPDHKTLELIDGRPKEKGMGQESDVVNQLLAAALVAHCRSNNLGWVSGPAAGFFMFPDRPNHLRKPDVSFVARGRYQGNRPPTGYAHLAPDLAVEVVSPTDLEEELDEKVEEFLQAGVRLIWVIHPRTRTAQVHRADGSGRRVREQEELDGEEVLPGFRCRLGDVLIPLPAAT